MRHASFFSGVGGLDLGFERAGIHTVSVSEIDPYACAVLAERFPDALNLGDIVKLAEKELGGSDGKVEIAGRLQSDDERHRAADQISEVGRRSHRDDLSDWRTADIWSGGFPCQDLSVAGKRAGFAGKRSSLAFTFLDLVEQRRPRWIVLENVPGLFSSNNGADFGRLLYEMEQLGYGVSWRTLDARYFGVAQRRRRVFIVGSLESDRAAEVLLECEGCERHPSPRWTQRQGVAGGAPDGSGIVGALPAGTHGFPDGVQEFLQGHFRVVGEDGRTVGASPDSDGVRAVDGLARRLDNQSEVDTFGAETHRALQARDWKGGVSNQDIGQEGYLVGYQTRADEKNGNFSLSEAEVANSLSALWPGDTSHRSMTLVQAVIQDSREMANKTQNGAGFSTEDISYTLTGVDRQAVATESTVPRSSLFRKVGLGAYRESEGLAGPNLASGGDVGGGSENIMTFSAHLTDASAEHRRQNLSLLTQGDAAVLIDSVDGTQDEDALLPVGLDSHRYRCCGNGVVAPVAEWIGRRIVEVDRRWREEGK